MVKKLTTKMGKLRGEEKDGKREIKKEKKAKEKDTEGKGGRRSQ
jgi:hypothetical protein